MFCSKTWVNDEKSIQRQFPEFLGKVSEIIERYSRDYSVSGTKFVDEGYITFELILRKNNKEVLCLNIDYIRDITRDSDDEYTMGVRYSGEEYSFVSGQNFNDMLEPVVDTFKKVIDEDEDAYIEYVNSSTLIKCADAQNKTNYAVQYRNMHTAMINLLTGTKSNIEEVNDLLNSLDPDEMSEDEYYDTIWYAFGLTDGSVEEINWREIDKHNNYYDYKTDTTYHILNNVAHDLYL